MGSHSFETFVIALQILYSSIFSLSSLSVYGIY